MFFRKLFHLFLFLVIFSPVGLLAGFFADNLVSISTDKSCAIKNILPGQKVLSLKDLLDNETLCLEEVAGIRIQENCTDSAIEIMFKSDEGEVSSLMIGENQKFCVIDKDKVEGNYPGTVMWVDAKDLQKGLRLKGYGGSSFMVQYIETVKLDKNVNIFDISLANFHTFYIVDSKGNKILTHNMSLTSLLTSCFLCSFWAGIEIGLLEYQFERKGMEAPFIMKVKSGATGVIYSVLAQGAAILTCETIKYLKNKHK